MLSWALHVTQSYTTVIVAKTVVACGAKTIVFCWRVGIFMVLSIRFTRHKIWKTCLWVSCPKPLDNNSVKFSHTFLFFFHMVKEETLIIRWKFALCERMLLLSDLPHEFLFVPNRFNIILKSDIPLRLCIRFAKDGKHCNNERNTFCYYWCM